MANDREIESLKLLMFNIGSLNLAVPVELVVKVVNYTNIYSSGLNHLGMARVGDGDITIIDLHKRLFEVSQIPQSGEKAYFIVVRNNSGEQFGILVTKTPSLIDVQSSLIRALPESYRRADTLEIASHVAVIPQEDTNSTIFILDADMLLPTVAGVK